MVDIPTGYFFLTVSGSGILALGTAIILTKLLGFKFTTKQVGGLTPRPTDTEESIAAFREEIPDDGRMHYIPQVTIKTAYGLGSRVRDLVHRFRGYVIKDTPTKNKQYEIVDAAIPPSQMPAFLRDLRAADYVFDAYKHYGSSAPEKVK